VVRRCDCLVSLAIKSHFAQWKTALKAREDEIEALKKDVSRLERNVESLRVSLYARVPTADVVNPNITAGRPSSHFMCY
jgi:hypothetical protein